MEKGFFRELCSAADSQVRLLEVNVITSTRFSQIADRDMHLAKLIYSSSHESEYSDLPRMTSTVLT